MRSKIIELRARNQGVRTFERYEIMYTDGSHSDLSIPTFPLIDMALDGSHKAVHELLN